MDDIGHYEYLLYTTSWSLILLSTTDSNWSQILNFCDENILSHLKCFYDEFTWSQFLVSTMNLNGRNFVFLFTLSQFRVSTMNLLDRTFVFLHKWSQFHACFYNKFTLSQFRVSTMNLHGHNFVFI